MEEYIFDIVQSVVGIGTLIVSIIVFLNTIKRTEKERWLNTARERFHSLLDKINEFFQLVNPQIFYDNYSVIYGAEQFPYSEKFAELKHMHSNIHYLSQEIHLYQPEGSEECIEIITKLLDALEQSATQIIEQFCYDIELRNGDKTQNINIDHINSLQASYEDKYDKIVEFVFKGLHVAQDSVLGKKKLDDSYKREFEERFRDEI